MISLTDLITKALTETGSSAKQAQALAERIIVWGAKNNVAGDKYYWPQSYRPLSPEERAEGIRADFTGGNLKEICSQYRVTPQTVYNIIRN